MRKIRKIFQMIDIYLLTFKYWFWYKEDYKTAKANAVRIVKGFNQ